MAAQTGLLRPLGGKRRSRNKGQSNSYIELPASSGFSVSELKRRGIYLPGSSSKPAKNKNGTWMVDLHFGKDDNEFDKRMSLYNAFDKYGARMLNLLKSHMRSYTVDEWDSLRNDILGWRVESSSDGMPAVGELVSFADEADYTIFQRKYPLFEVISVDTSVKEIYKWERNQYKNVQIRHIDHLNSEVLSSPHGYAAGWVNHERLQIEHTFRNGISNEVRALTAANIGKAVVMRFASGNEAEMLDELRIAIRNKIKGSLNAGTHGSTRIYKMFVSKTLFKLLKGGWELDDARIQALQINKAGTNMEYSAESEEWERFFGNLEVSYFDLNQYKTKAAVDITINFFSKQQCLRVEWKISDKTQDPLPTGSPEF